MSVIDAALNRSRTVISTLVLLLICGTYAYLNIPKEAEPDVQVPVVYIALKHEGISPEDSEIQLIRPLEQELRAIEGVKEMRSRAYQGGGSVTLDFYSDKNIDEALNDVREKVDVAKADLPKETEEPQVFEVNVGLFPVLAITLSGDIPERQLRHAARELKDAVEGISTVLEVAVLGERDEQVEIIIDPMKVESYGLDHTQFLNLMGRSNTLVTAGALESGDGRFSIKVPGLFNDLHDIINMPLKTSGDAVVVLGDIAEIRRAFKDATTYSYVNGQPAMTLEVTKRIGTNVIETIDAVREVVAERSDRWPDNLQIGFAQDSSNEIRTMLSELQNSVILAVLLVMVIVIWALGWRSGILVGLAIPGSFLTAMLLLFAIGLTVNTVVLFALILSVGILVDGAIVVTEYADRKMLDGETRRTAYPMAAKRMAWPIIASTGTTLAAFLPLAFWPDVVGDFMRYLPITILMTLSASLLMALIFLPTLGALFGRPGAEADPNLAVLAAGGDQELNGLQGPTALYVAFLKRALQFSWLVVPGAIVGLIAIWMYFGENGAGVEFFPDVEPDQAQLQIRARGNLGYGEQAALVQEVEKRVLALNAAALERTGTPWFDTVYTSAGYMQPGRADRTSPDTIGIMQLEYAFWETRPTANYINERVLDATRDIYGLQIEVAEVEAGPPTGKDIQVQISALDPNLVAPVAQQVYAHVQNMADLKDFEDGGSLPGIDWQVAVDRAQALKFGADISMVGSSVKLVTNGLGFSSYRPDDSTEEIDIIARYPDDYRFLDQIDNLKVVTSRGAVPVGNFIDRSAKPRTDTLRRSETRRVMTVKANVTDGVNVDAKVNEVKSWIAAQNFDPRVSIAFKGKDEEQARAGRFLLKAFMVAVFIMTLILLTQFNSFYSTLLIMMAVVMSTAGVLLGLLITDQPFGIVMNGISVVALAGIVVNNNIVLIDTFDRLKGDYDRYWAILRTGAQRLRPVMLTTITTILGLIPMVLQFNVDFIARHITVGGPSSQWWVQLSTAIAFGLAFATLLTLVVTPCALYLPTQIRKGWGRLRTRGTA